MANNLTRMKELIKMINSLNQSYYGDNESPYSDYEYDKLVDELIELEKQTGIVFADSPTHKVGSASSSTLKKVEHTKPMLSAQKTKSLDELYSFMNGHRSILSWKLDGLTIVLRYSNGQFVQALTRGEDGLVGEDITHTVKHIRGVPQTVSCLDDFEVRGEGVISYPSFELINRYHQYANPRNAASGLVRATHIDKTKLSNMDFIAFELIGDTSFTSAKDQLDYLVTLSFNVVDYKFIKDNAGFDTFKKCIDSFNPKDYVYPVDGLILEFDDIAFGKGLGCTTHHENRMMALKWQDDTYETIFRGIELLSGKNGSITINALFDEVEIDGTKIQKANLQSLSNFEKFQFGEGDTIIIHKANMVIPQVVDNLTRSNTYVMPDRCPCCGALLEVRTNDKGTKQLYCPNERCIGKSSQRIARYCDSDAMNIKGLSASTIEKLISHGIISKCSDIYHLKEHEVKILDIPGFGVDSYLNLLDSIKESRNCHLYQFLNGIGIASMTTISAKAIDEYFYGSFDKFEEAIKNEFDFFHIEGVSENLHRNIYKWYNDKEEESFYRPLLQEITFIGHEKTNNSNNPFKNMNVVVTGTLGGMNKEDITELLTLVGANVSNNLNEHTDYLLVGKDPENTLIASAMTKKIKIIMESKFLEMLENGNI